MFKAESLGHEVSSALLASVVKALDSIGIMKPGVVVKIVDEAGKMLVEAVEHDVGERNEKEILERVLIEVANIPKEGFEIEETEDKLVVRIKKSYCPVRKYLYPACNACPLPGLVKGVMEGVTKRRWRLNVRFEKGRAIFMDSVDDTCSFTLNRQ